MYYGFVRVAAAVPELRVADCTFNIKEIISMVQQAEKEKVEVISFPELCITGYTCGDLFHHQQLLLDAEKALAELLLQTAATSCTILVGMPLSTGVCIYNVAVVIQSGQILGVVPKTFLPNNNEFGEKRWFAPADSREKSIMVLGQQVPFGTDILFSDKKFSFAIEICQDFWVPIPPSSEHTMHGAQVIFNLSASNELTGKAVYRRSLVKMQSAKCHTGYVYVSSGVGESTSNLVFSGSAFIAENGKILSEGERYSMKSHLVINEIDIDKIRKIRISNLNFQNSKSDQVYRVVEIKQTQFKSFSLKRIYSKYPFVPSGEELNHNCFDVFSIQTQGLAKRWKHTHAETLIIGVSGGLDSTLALLVCAKTADLLGYDRKRILGVTMPGFGTTNRTYDNATGLMKALGVTIKEISINDAIIQHFKDINHDSNVHDITYENAQARERTQILMDLANQQNGLVVGTGDMSEAALGWMTYNGDHMSMYGVNGGLPKTFIRPLVAWISDQFGNDDVKAILKDVLNTPISPELLPADKDGNIAQKTEETVGPYELHDFFLYYLVHSGFSIDKVLFLTKEAFADDYTEKEIKKWLKIFIKRFFTQQFKRSCSPDCPQVGTVNISPNSWRMPNDAIAFQMEE